MPPRLQLRSLGNRGTIRRWFVAPEPRSVCFFCSLSRIPAQTSIRSRRRIPPTRRSESTIAAAIPADRPAANPRKELEDILLQLQKRAANYVNLSRLQLALNGLRQQPGSEAIRVAILGLTNASEASKTVKDVLRLLLADPLKDQEPWEKEVEQHDLAQPMIIRVGVEEHVQPGAISLTKGNLLHEVNVSSATLNGHNLEILLMETNPFTTAQERGALEGFEDSVLVPTVDIPSSDTGRYSPITTPVHKALIVADGILGAASAASMPTLESSNVIASAVNLPHYNSGEAEDLPFTPIDVTIASIGLGLVRKDLRNAIEFEHLWFQSNLPRLVDWLKADIMTTPDNITKPPVRNLISSLLTATLGAVQTEEARRLGSSISQTSSTDNLQNLQRDLENWAESAHSELQEQLDIAFAGKRWRQLRWWKLFWRVDDVGMLTNDIINQRYLPGAERSAIFLAGKMDQAGVPLISSRVQPISDSLERQEISSGQADESATLSETPPWPTNIPRSRHQLQNNDIPALQALAQKIVLQALSLSGFTTALSALCYVGITATSLYEAGAIAALGIVFSMSRLQKKWEGAREVWESEVREEGRKAVRDVENVIGATLAERAANGANKGLPEGQAELDEAKELVLRAQEVLEKLK
ncbi:hypothetical protein F4778DRAFT_1035 [Xylariomycetidae sp. FL2044]|nr:hypothetical protein F4778DRAFT_1035 [Xylariomycetidae sp. FL2044]